MKNIREYIWVFAISMGLFIIINWLIIIPIVINMYSKPLSRFELPKNTKTKIHFSEGVISDSIVPITITPSTLTVGKNKKQFKLKNIKYQYWHQDGDINILCWETDKHVIQYKSIGFDKPHSIDIYILNNKGRAHNQFVF